jgi:hypothetical protein
VSQSEGLSYGILLQAIVFLPTTLLSMAGLWLFGWGSGLRGDLSKDISQPAKKMME